MKLAKNLENLGTESAFSVLAEAKKLKGSKPYKKFSISKIIYCNTYIINYYFFYNNNFLF